MHKFSLTVNMVYNDNSTLQQTYRLDWDSNKKDFEKHMSDIMETLAVAEEPGTLDCIDILDIKFEKTLWGDDRIQVQNFVNDNDLKCKF